MPITKGIKQLCAEAEAEIVNLSVEDVRKVMGDPKVTVVDIRDIRELQREGVIPGAMHAPRDMLEFWVDPESPYYRPAFGNGNRFIFFCAAGGRSALAAQQMQRMGLEPVAHMAGGFRAWKQAGAPIAAWEPAKKKPA
jgi:rhodanese-related sulfurtransferase